MDKIKDVQINTVAAEHKQDRKFVDADGVLTLPRLSIFGSEILDPTPMAPPVGYNPQPSMMEHVRNMVRQELSRQARDEGFETAEEADDFDVGDDFDPTSPFEYNFDPPAASPEPVQPVSPAPAPVPPNPPADGPAASPAAPTPQPAAPGLPGASPSGQIPSQ